MADGIRLDDITDDQLEQLYAERDRLRIEVDHLYVTANPRTCLWPGCRRQYDALSWASGNPTRPEWSGRGWRIAKGLLPGGDRVCPDHGDLVTAHMTHSTRDNDGRLSGICACGWSASARRWHRVTRALWEEHLLDVADEAALPARDTQEPDHG